jgi:uncharacterized protein YwqG
MPPDVKALLAHSPRPALRLVPDGSLAATSWLGCVPEVDATTSGLALLACIDLATLQQALPVEWLPGAGSLRFYYDVEEQPWLCGPDDRAGFAVVWSSEQQNDTRKQGIRFEAIETYPDESPHEDKPEHRIAGWAQSIQEPVERECQYHGGGNPEEWKLLLQLDSDDSLDWMWGDVGKLYFMTKESDARQRDFSKAWCVLQCH